MERRKQRSLRSRLTLTRRLTGWLLALVILATAAVAVLGTPLPAALEKLTAVQQARWETKLQAWAEERVQSAVETARSSLGSPFQGAYPPAREAQDIFVYDIQIQEQIEDLFDRLMNPERQSFEEYSGLFYQVSEEEIRRCYNGELAVKYRPYTDRAVTFCMDLDDCHYIEVTVCAPGRSLRVFSFCARYSHDRFYFTHADADELVMLGVFKEESGLNTLGEPYVRFLAARTAGSNAVQKVVPGYLTKRLAEGHWTCAPVFAWQQDDGSVVVGIWIANFTYEDMQLDKADVSMEDGGEIICRYTGAMGETVPEGACRLIELVIPADQIATGLAPWSKNVSCDCTVK